MNSIPCPACGKDVRFFTPPAVGDRKICLGCATPLQVSAVEPEIVLVVTEASAPPAGGSGGSGGISEDY